MHIKRFNEGYFGSLPIATGYLSPDNSIPIIPNDIFNKESIEVEIVNKRIIDNQYLMTIKCDKELTFSVDKYINHKIGDKINIPMSRLNESIDMEIEFISDALIMAFQDRNMDIEEIPCLKNATPEESIIIKSRAGQRYGPIKIEDSVFSIGTYAVPKIVGSGGVVVDDDMRLCIIYNNRIFSPAQIEGAMSRFYRRIVKFGWCKVGDKVSKNIPSGDVNIRLTCLNINIMKVKPKTKKK